jgi:transcriptional regulator with XRE-family HTH domain
MSTPLLGNFTTKIGTNIESVVKKNEPILTFGQFLAIEREKRGLSKSEAARSIGITNATLARFEKCVTLKGFHKMALNRMIEFYKINEKSLSIVKNPPLLSALKNKKKQSKPIITTYQIKKQTLLITIIDSLKEYSDKIKPIQGKGTLFDTIKETTQENIRQAKELLEEVQVFDTFIASHQDKPELPQ